jgi:hypothetical protein
MAIGYIENELTTHPEIILGHSSPYKMSYLYGNIMYPRTGEMFVKNIKFIVDTDAAISILNNELKIFINEKFKPIGYAAVQYGGNLKKLPVYEMQLKIKGEVFNLRMAYDKDMQLTSLLGQFDFLNKMDALFVNCNKDSNKTR